MPACKCVKRTVGVVEPRLVFCCSAGIEIESQGDEDW